MKIISDPIHLQKEFSRLLHNYHQYYWTVAWASITPTYIEFLTSHRDRIKKIIVGLHFYQTHPKFIEKFLSDKEVRYIKQANGTFHPKLYLFQNSRTEWEALIGSANFTNEAFTNNSELSVLISSKDEDSENIYKSIIQFITEIWNDTVVFTDDELKNYWSVWINQQSKIKSLSGHQTSKRGEILTHQIKILNKTWDEYIRELKKDRVLKERLELLKRAHGWFSKFINFNALDVEKRKSIAGLTPEPEEEGQLDWGYFGSMVGAGYFKQKIYNNDINISNALDQIPLNGNITKNHYLNYISYFRESFPKGHHIATSTRLLAIKRPDVFVCLDSKNRKGLCKEFKIKISEMTYERYWDEIIERIMDAIWWQNPKPQNELEIKINNSRSALLDSIFYDPE